MAIITQLIYLLILVVKVCQMRKKLAFILVLVLAILLPVCDLLLFKLLASVFTIPLDSLSRLFVQLILCLSLVACFNALLKYFIKLKKIEYVNSIVTIVNDNTGTVLKSSVNWLRMVLLETTNIILFFAHILVIILFAFYLNIYLGLCLFLIVSCVVFLCLRSFNREQNRQVRIRFNKFLKAKERGEKNVVSRVKSSERLILVVNMFVFIFCVILIFLYVKGITDDQTSLIFLFVSRILGSNLSNFIGALMRIARAWANIFDKYDRVLAFFYSKTSR